jgi:heat shock protein HslJ
MLDTLALTLLLQTAGTNPPVSSVQPIAPPHEGRWVVEVIDTIKVMPDSKVTMRIEDGNIAGMASCNSYRGNLTVAGASMAVGELLRTMKTCDAARLSEENDFLALLREVVRYEMQSRDFLVLKTSGGKTIVARRAR